MEERNRDGGKRERKRGKERGGKERQTDRKRNRKERYLREKERERERERGVGRAGSFACNHSSESNLQLLLEQVNYLLILSVALPVDAAVMLYRILHGT